MASIVRQIFGHDTEIELTPEEVESLSNSITILSKEKREEIFNSVLRQKIRDVIETVYAEQHDGDEIDYSKNADDVEEIIDNYIEQEKSEIEGSLHDSVSELNCKKKYEVTVKFSKKIYMTCNMEIEAESEEDAEAEAEDKFNDSYVPDEDFDSSRYYGEDDEYEFEEATAEEK